MPATQASRDQRRIEYEAHLASPQWRSLRLKALERDGHACRICNTTKSLDVHHRTYERFGHEDLNDLTVLCRKCHETHHGRTFGKPAKRKPQRPAQPRVQSPDLEVVAAHIWNDMVKDPRAKYTRGTIVQAFGLPKGQATRACGFLAAQGRVIQASRHSWFVSPAWEREHGLEPIAVPAPPGLIPITSGRKHRTEAASKGEARKRIRSVLETLEPLEVVSTAHIAALAEVQVSRTGGFLAGMARRHEGVEQLGNGRWRRTQHIQANAA